MQLTDKLVMKNLKLNKKRTTVTVIGIILAVALLTSLATLVSSFQMSLIESQKSKNGDYHVSFSGVTGEDLDFLKQNRSIERMYTIHVLGEAYLPESKNDYKPYACVISMEPDAYERTTIHLVEGRFPQNAEEVVIPKHLKTNGMVGYKIGDEICLELGKRVTVEGHEPLTQALGYMGEAETIINAAEKKYTVVGIMDRPGYGVEAYTAPGYTFLTLDGESNAQDNITVYARLTKEGIKKHNEVIASILGVDVELYQKVNSETSGATEEEYARYAEEMTHARFAADINYWLMKYENPWPVDGSLMAMFVIALIIAFIILFTSVYCIENSFEISVAEKIRQLGMLAGIGATKKQIRRFVYKEAGVLGGIGIAGGVLSGLFATYVLTHVCNLLLKDMMNAPIYFSPSVPAILGSVIFGVITIYLSAFGSARKAGKISPMEAVLNRKEYVGNRKKLKTPRYVKKLFGIGGVISYKSIKRSKSKYRTAVVSILICTVTFIVISYFMSMAFDMVSLAYVNQKYNLCFDLYLNDESELDKTVFDNLEYADKYVYERCEILNVDQAVYTKQYKEYMDMHGLPESEHFIYLIAMEDLAFEAYARECGIFNPGDNAVLVNDELAVGLGEDGKQAAVIPVFQMDRGDTMHFYDLDSSKAIINENDEVIPETIERIDYSLNLAGVTDIRPMGYAGSNNTQFLVISDSAAKKAEIKMRPQYKIYFISRDADALQEEITRDLLMTFPDDAGYSIYNRDQNARNERSWWLLLEIFAYGFISVIALIGITSIINTLSTGVELRSRDFATLRSVGMTDKQFHHMICMETLFTGGKSLAYGVLLGMLISYGINRFECRYDTAIPFHPPIFEAVLVCVVVFGIIYVIIRMTLKNIMKRNIVETIKNENM